MIGAPLHLGSLSGGRFDLAPDVIRQTLARYSTFADGIDVRTVAGKDAGDLDIAASRPETALQEIAGAVGGTLDTYDVVVILGGDNSVTRPGCRGLGPDLPRVGLLTLDAHHDLRDLDGGLSNGNPIRALLKDGLPGDHVIQIGIQPFANSRAYARVAREEGITVVTAQEVRTRGIEAVVSEALHVLALKADRIYVDLDLDVLDRAYAPACPGSRPGGLAPWEVLAGSRLAGSHPKVRAIDLVEVDPTRDVADATVLTAAGCLLAFAAGVAARGKEVQ